MAAPVNATALQLITKTFWDTEIYARHADLATAWTSFTPTWTGSTTNPVLGNGTLTGAYKRWDTSKMVTFRIALVTGSTTTYGSGTWAFTLPPALTPVAISAISGHIFDTSAAGRYALVAYANNGGSATAALAVNGTTGVTSAVPMTWATGDVLELGGTYEIT